MGEPPKKNFYIFLNLMGTKSPMNIFWKHKFFLQNYGRFIISHTWGSLYKTCLMSNLWLKSLLLMVLSGKVFNVWLPNKTLGRCLVEGDIINIVKTCLDYQQYHTCSIYIRGIGVNILRAIVCTSPRSIKTRTTTK